MEIGSGPERLAATREVVIVLRLVVETSGHVLYGEVLEPPTAIPLRFVGMTGLMEAIRDWLRESFREPDASDGPPRGVGSTENDPVG